MDIGDENNIMLAQIEELIGFMLKRSGVRSPDGSWNQRIKDFLQLSADERKCQFPALYLQLERFLQEKDKQFPVSRSAFRKELTA